MSWITCGFLYKGLLNSNLQNQHLQVRKYFDKEWWVNISILAHKIPPQFCHKQGNNNTSSKEENDFWIYLMNFKPNEEVQKHTNNTTELKIHLFETPNNKHNLHKSVFIRIDVLETVIDKWIKSITNWIEHVFPALDTITKHSEDTHHKVHERKAERESVVVVMWTTQLDNFKQSNNSSADLSFTSVFTKWAYQQLNLYGKDVFFKSSVNPWICLHEQHNNHNNSSALENKSNWFHKTLKLSMQLQKDIVNQYHTGFMVYLTACIFTTIQTKLMHACKSTAVEMAAAIQNPMTGCTDKKKYDIWNIEQPTEFLELLYTLQKYESDMIYVENCENIPAHCAFSLSYSIEDSINCDNKSLKNDMMMIPSHMYWNCFPFAIQKLVKSSSDSPHLLWSIHCRYYPSKEIILLENQFCGSVFANCYDSLCTALLNQIQDIYCVSGHSIRRNGNSE